MRSPPWRRIRALSPLLLLLTIAFGCSFERRWRQPCSLADKPSPGSAEAIEALAALQLRNEELKTYKGLGRIRMVSGKRQQSMRMAWLASVPDCLRIEILGPYGRPVISLTTDGQDLYLRDFSHERFYSQPLGRNNPLRELISVDLHPRELVALLAGRIALQPFDGIALMPERGDDAWLTLSSNGQGVVQRIHLAGAGRTPSRVEVLEPGGGMRYAVDIRTEMAAGEFVVPEELILWGDEGSRITLNVEQVWANPVVDAGRFVLEAPREERRGDGWDQRDAGR